MLCVLWWLVLVWGIFCLWVWLFVMYCFYCCVLYFYVYGVGVVGIGVMFVCYCIGEIKCYCIIWEIDGVWV